MKKGPKLQNWKEEKQKKERSTQMGQQKKKKKETNKQKIKHIKWINEKHKHEKNFHFVIMKSTYTILRTKRTFRAEFASPAVVIVEREFGDSML